MPRKTSGEKKLVRDIISGDARQRGIFPVCHFISLLF